MTGAGAGTVVSTPAGINCPTTCAGSFLFEASVGLTATPAGGSSFTGWGGACSGTGACNVTMTQARAVTATFAVAPAAVAAVVVTAPLTNLDEGATGQLTATVRDAAGNVLTGRIVTWSSSDQGTATVTSAGQVAGIAEGDTVIVTATSEGVSGTAKVVVRSLYFIANEVAVGRAHTCAVRIIGGTYCWGSNAFGQLGNPLNPGGGVPMITGGPTVFTHIAAGTTHSCGLTSAGAAYCFGLNNSRELGVGSTVPYETLPLPVSGGLVFARLFGRNGTTCGLTSNGTAYCWGHNLFDQLALGTLTSPVTAPGAVVGGHRFQTLAMGSAHTCGIDTGGALWCWGNNSPGQLGIGSPPVQVAVPTLVKSGTRFTAVAGGSDHTCAVDSDGLVWCWGANHQGQLGQGTTQQRTTPVRIASNLTFTQIAAGDRFTCAVATSGDVWCWGLNNGSQLASGTTGNSLVPLKASTTLGFTSIATNHSTVCAIAVNRRVYCWGTNAHGEAGSAPSLPILTPTAVLRP